MLKLCTPYIRFVRRWQKLKCNLIVLKSYNNSVNDSFCSRTTRCFILFAFKFQRNYSHYSNMVFLINSNFQQRCATWMNFISTFCLIFIHFSFFILQISDFLIRNLCYSLCCLMSSIFTWWICWMTSLWLAFSNVRPLTSRISSPTSNVSACSAGEPRIVNEKRNLQ